MDTISAKENIPTMMEDQVVPSSKMGSQTPRQPLVDLKQVSRTSSVDIHVTKLAKSRSLTSMCTPQKKKSHKKIQPSTLVYRDNTEKENGLDFWKSEERPSGKYNMGEIPEECLDTFVTEVLDKCVLDMMNERCAAESGERNNKEDIILSANGSALNQQDADDSKDLPLTNKEKDTDLTASGSAIDAEDSKHLLSTNIDKRVDQLDMVMRGDSFNEVSKCSEITEAVTNVCVEDCTTVTNTDNQNLKLGEKNEKCSPTNEVDLSLSELNEDSLLADVSVYTDCSESFCESTKSEEELLASFVDTPKDREEHTKDESAISDDGNKNDSAFEKSSAPSPRLTFLEKAAFMQRVKKATSSLASSVVSKEDMVHQLHWIPSDGTAKLTHNVACSPMPQLETNPCSCTLVKDCKLDTCVYCSRFELSESKFVNNCDSAIVLDTDNGPVCQEIILNSTASPSSSVPDLMKTAYTSPGNYQSVACSPIPTFSHDSSTSTDIITFHDVSLVTDPQTPVRVIVTQSASCSPMEMETQSVMCSPMLVPMSDAAIQNVRETHSIMCSPIQVPVFDATTQSGNETRSTMCSPMVPCPSQNKSVMVSGPEQVDVGVGTEQACAVDAEVDVRPDMQTVATEMEDQPMTNCGTSMTPLKISKKNGRKLTADDIRKQHPRVLANELDTLWLQNTKLEAEVHNMEKDCKKLVAQENLQKQVEELSSSLEEEQKRFSRINEEWRIKCEGLESELGAMRLQHEREVISIREEYEKTDYHDHFLSSQKLVRQLQAELEQYTQLLGDIEQSQILQGQLEEALSTSYMKVKATGDGILSMKNTLEQQKKELSEQRGELKTELLLLEDNRMQMQAEREQMTNIVATCKDRMLELNSELQSVTSELSTTRETMSTLQEQLDRSSKELGEVKPASECLSIENSELKETCDRLEGVISNLQTSITLKEGQLEQTSKSLSESQNMHKKDVEKLQESEEQKHLLVVNLQRTLEMREHDIDQLEKDLFECREVIYTQLEASKAAEECKKITTTELELMKSENAMLKDCCASLRAKEQDLRATLDSTQDELTGTKDHATRLLKQQGTEIADCSTAIGELTDHMTDVLDNLNLRAGKQKELINMEAMESVSTQSLTCISITPPSHNAQLSQNSLVSQILNAAKSLQESSASAPVTKNRAEDSQTGPREEEIENRNFSHTHLEALCKDSEVVDSPGTLSRKRLGFSGNSAFAPIKSGRLSVCVKNDKITDTNAVVVSNLESNSPESKIISTRVKIDEASSQEMGLSVQLSKVSEIFVQIIRVAQLIEKALRSSLQDNRSENDDLNCRLSQCEYTENRLQAELDVKQSEVDKNKNLAKQLQDKLEEMSDNFGRLVEQDAEVKRQQLEMRHLRGKIQGLEGEKELLNEQIGDLLQQIEGHSSSTAATVDVRSQREVLILQKKVEKYRNQLLQKEEQVDEISAKAARRIKKLEDNWKKADEEVCRFDELVDIIRDVMGTNQIVAQDAELRRLVRLIDGQESVSAFNREKRATELKPHKTSTW